MTTGDILWCVLMGFIMVWAAGLFGLWERWQQAVEDWVRKHGRH